MWAKMGQRYLRNHDFIFALDAFEEAVRLHQLHGNYIKPTVFKKPTIVHVQVFSVRSKAS